MNNEWNTEPPKECGYYLATWKYGRASRRVSEFWFDGRNWWTSRAYIGEDVMIIDTKDCITEKIVAWMPKPKPYRTGK